MAASFLRPLLLLLLLLLAAVSVVSAADDGAAMLAIAKAFQPPPSGWSSTSSNGYCRWPGVVCNSGGGVTSLSLADKSLSGEISPEISSLSELKSAFFQRNKLSGQIPSFAKLSSLQEISLDKNLFNGVAAGAFGGLTSLQTLSMSDNQNLTSWIFPVELTDSASLTTIYLDNTNIFGTLPDIFDSFSSLQNLRLSYNNITGPLPPSLAKSSIQNFWINNQMSGISGTIDVLSSMSSLVQVWLHKNQFTGPIPDLSKCEGLFDLQLRDNQLTGIVPPSLGSIGSLKNVSLDNNKLQGPVPSFAPDVKVTLDNNDFCNSKAGQSCSPQVTTLLEVAGGFGFPAMLADTWQGDDACGWAYVTCDSSGRIITLNLGKHGFVGIISPAIANLTSLKNLLLNDNNLTGSIPKGLTFIPTLQSLDVSNNNLTGDIPQFPSSVKFVYKPGNALLGTDVDNSSTSGSGHNSGGNADGSSGGKTPVIVGVVIAILVFLAIMCFVVYKFIMKRKYGKFGRMDPEMAGKEMLSNAISAGSTSSGGAVRGTNGYGISNFNGLNSPSSGDNSDRYILEGGNVTISMEVLRQVTHNFSEENVLGRGGFGVVYKGELHDGTKIAVKRMESSTVGTKGMNEFQAEIAVLTKVRHRHLVALLGYCINGNERLLVYEYMPQGTLGQHLFEWRELGYPPLTWKQRVTIALDVARGVEYLHSLAQQSFIHRDLKPSNILLGDDMRAKVADFGLVKNAPDGKYSVETRLAGTFGYLAPEYAATGRVTTKVDVYAFGVVLMEMITGRKALDDSLPDERSHLVTWFRRILINKENVPKALDETLEPDEETMASIYRVSELAGHCTAREPHQRPDMGHAVNVLGPLVEQWKPSSQEEEESFGIDLHMSLPQALQRWQANEGTSSMFHGDFSYSQTQSSIPSKPAGFPDSFNSTDGR